MFFHRPSIALLIAINHRGKQMLGTKASVGWGRVRARVWGRVVVVRVIKLYDVVKSGVGCCGSPLQS